jgi:hypothetical protein
MNAISFSIFILSIGLIPCVWILALIEVLLPTVMLNKIVWTTIIALFATLSLLWMVIYNSFGECKISHRRYYTYYMWFTFLHLVLCTIVLIPVCATDSIDADRFKDYLCTFVIGFAPSVISAVYLLNA